MVDPWLVLGALLLEAAIGYPGRLHKYISHPVTWMGNSIHALEMRWNRTEWTAKRRKLSGMACLVAVAGGAGLVMWALDRLTMRLPFGVVAVTVVAAIGLAQRSLYEHAAAVLNPLAADDLPAARAAVGHIVGRDVQNLDQSGVAAAALESVAESFNDGVVAPAFWFLIGGLPGLFVYKGVNTADSMIGHVEPRWRNFGWAAARTDDVMNLIPARIAGVLIVIAGCGGWRTMLADGAKHASPNAGWPEAAMAGALDRRLGGPATYDAVRHERPVFGHGAIPAAGDLRRGLSLYVRACGLLWMLLALGGLLWRLS